MNAGIDMDFKATFWGPRQKL